MDDQTTRFIGIVNRLRRATADGRVLWHSAENAPHAFAATLDEGVRATVGTAAGGTAVVFTLTNQAGVEMIHLDSSRAASDLLRLALLQLFTCVRDTRAKEAAEAALKALHDL